MTCDATWIGGFDVALSCVRETGHGATDHRNDIGTTWDDYRTSASGDSPAASS